LADFLVLEGVPFREAHHVVGGVVRTAEDANVQIGELDEATLVAAHPALGKPGARAALDPRAAVERRALVGGPAKARVQEAIAAGRQAWAEVVPTRPPQAEF